MQGASAAPFRATMATALLCALIALAAAMLVRTPPWLGLELTPDPASHRIKVAGVRSGGPAAMAMDGAGEAPAWLTAVDGIALTDVDRIEESDFLPTYRDVDDLFARQDRVMAALRAPPVRLDFEGADGRPFSVMVTPGARPASDLPALFWLQLVFGGGAVLIGGWLWSLRPRDPAVRMFALTGLGLLCSAAAAAVYSSRELALDGTVFRVLSAINHLAPSCSAAGWSPCSPSIRNAC